MSTDPLTQALCGVRVALDGWTAVDLTTETPESLRDGLVRARRLLSQCEAMVGKLAHAAERGGALVGTGALDAADYLTRTGGGSPGRLRTAATVAAAMEKSPALAAAVTSGNVPLENAAVLAGVAGNPSFESAGGPLLDAARVQPMRGLRRQADRWQAEHSPEAEVDRAGQQRHLRSLSLRLLPDGMTAVSGLLDPPSAAAVRASLNAIVEQTAHDQSGRIHEQRMADALTTLCDLYSRGGVTGGRNSARVIVTVPYETVFERASARGTTATGETIDAETVRAACCDASLHRLVTRGRSTVLDLGSATRTASDTQFLALTARDEGCRFPGCVMPPSVCDAHHIRHVVAGGLTNIDQMVLTCYVHHQLVHSPGWSMTGTGDEIRITTPMGDAMTSRPPGFGRPPPGPAFDRPPDGSGQPRRLFDLTVA